MTLELLIQLLPLLQMGFTAVEDIVKELQAAGHDPKAPLPAAHSMAAQKTLAPIQAALPANLVVNLVVSPLGSPDAPEGG